jgi:hypothetical protein
MQPPIPVPEPGRRHTSLGARQEPGEEGQREAKQHFWPPSPGPIQLTLFLPPPAPPPRTAAASAASSAAAVSAVAAPVVTSPVAASVALAVADPAPVAAPGAAAATPAPLLPQHVRPLLQPRVQTHQW